MRGAKVTLPTVDPNNIVTLAHVRDDDRYRMSLYPLVAGLPRSMIEK